MAINSISTLQEYQYFVKTGNDIYYDTGSVGIGTTTPNNTYALDVVGNANISNNFVVDTTTLYVNATNNNVGIGTATPNSSYSLDVVGNINFTGTLYQDGYEFVGGSGGGTGQDPLDAAIQAAVFMIGV